MRCHKKLCPMVSMWHPVVLASVGPKVLETAKQRCICSKTVFNLKWPPCCYPLYVRNEYFHFHRLHHTIYSIHNILFEWAFRYFICSQPHWFCKQWSKPLKNIWKNNDAGHVLALKGLPLPLNLMKNTVICPTQHCLCINGQEILYATLYI